MSDPIVINSFRPYRSDKIAKGMLKITVTKPNVVSKAPRSVTDIPSSGRKTGIATEKKPRPTASGLAAKTTRPVFFGTFPKNFKEQVHLFCVL
jgi:hypothetical protein